MWRFIVKPIILTRFGIILPQVGCIILYHCHYLLHVLIRNLDQNKTVCFSKILQPSSPFLCSWHLLNFIGWLHQWFHLKSFHGHNPFIGQFSRYTVYISDVADRHHIITHHSLFMIYQNVSSSCINNISISNHHAFDCRNRSWIYWKYKFRKWTLSF